MCVGHAPHCLLCVKEDEENHDLLLLEQFGRDGLFDRRVVAESKLQKFFRQLLQLLGFAEPLKRPGEERTLITFEHAIQASATHATARHSTAQTSRRAHVRTYGRAASWRTHHLAHFIFSPIRPLLLS